MSRSDVNRIGFISFTLLLAFLQACAPAVRGGPYVTRSAMAAQAARHAPASADAVDGVRVVYGRFGATATPSPDACTTPEAKAASHGAFTAVICQDATPLSYAAYVNPEVYADSAPNDEERERLRKIAVDELLPRADPVALQ